MTTLKIQKKQENQRRIPRQVRARQKVEAVMDACTQVLARKGYQGATILELSLESGVAVPTLYQYFSNKDAIFLAWVERSIDQVLGRVAQVQGNLAGAVPGQSVDMLVRAALLSVGGLRSSLRNLIGEVPAVLSSQVVDTMEQKTVALIEELFAEQIAGLAVAELHVRLTLLVRLISGYFLQAVFNSERELDVDTEAREIASLVKLYLGQLGIEMN